MRYTAMTLLNEETALVREMLATYGHDYVSDRWSSDTIENLRRKLDAAVDPAVTPVRDQQTKEDVYDTQINPLIAKVIAICKAHSIGIIVHAAIPTPDDPSLVVTTALATPEYLTDCSTNASLNIRAATEMLTNGFVAFVARRKLA